MLDSYWLVCNLEDSILICVMLDNLPIIKLHLDINAHWLEAKYTNFQVRVIKVWKPSLVWRECDHGNGCHLQIRLARMEPFSTIGGELVMRGRSIPLQCSIRYVKPSHLFEDSLTEHCTLISVFNPLDPVVSRKSRCWKHGQWVTYVANILGVRRIDRVRLYTRE